MSSPLEGGPSGALMNLSGRRAAPPRASASLKLAPLGAGKKWLMRIAKGVARPREQGRGIT
ncbi:MAG: hypothetical protein CSA76_06955 [Spirochaetales bacterium]|nr:MAG: hypothetical protein CSA76_06955 [Spirochaetales bacterium]